MKSELPPKAYKNLDFLNSPRARTLRILSEYMEPQSRLERHRIRDTIVFFGSSRFCDQKTAQTQLAGASTPEAKEAAQRCKVNSRYYEQARQLSSMLTEWSKQVSDDGNRFVVCSGGGPGIMEAANRGAHEASGRSIGFNISLPEEQEPNPYITPDLCFQFHYFFMRKLWFAYLAKALIVFPGGFGTMDEMMEILTLAQTDKFRKDMLVVIYGTDYWNKVINFEALVEHGTISPEDRELFRFADDPDHAYETITSWLDEHHPRPRL